MFNRFLTGFVISAVLAFPMPALAEGYKRIKSKDQFTATVVDKKVVWDSGYGIIRSNGKTDGKTNDGGKYYGSWVWQNGYYCRNLVINKKETGTNCLKIELAGADKLRLTYDKGKGRVLDAVIK